MSPSRRNQGDAWRDENSARLVVDGLGDCSDMRALVIEDATGLIAGAPACMNEGGAMPAPPFLHVCRAW